MKAARRFHVVLVTAPDVKAARALARAALAARLIACANLVPRLESHYWWKGKMESSAEVLLIMKTTQVKLRLLEELFLRKHPYDMPEILALTVERGTRRYLDWLAGSVR
jgi:periplasmic divalent cation tolerance protein